MARLSVAVTVALLFLSSAASAKIPVLDLGDFCHFMPIQVDRPHAQAHGFSHFSCQTGNFAGLIAKTNDGARAIIASIQVKDRPGDQFLLQLSYPLLNGGTWSVFYTRDGYSMKLYKSGTYNVVK